MMRDKALLVTTLLLAGVIIAPVFALESCPAGCECLSAADAKTQGYYSYCGGKELICGVDKNQVPLYCYEKPAPTTTPPPLVSCSPDCTCLLPDDAKMNGYQSCGPANAPCGYAKDGRAMYCFTLPVADSDQDGISDSTDNCPSLYNPAQEDQDTDGVGDACDPCDDRDTDKDGIRNCEDLCPDRAEVFNGVEDADGCPDSAPSTEFTFSLQPFLDPAGGRNNSVTVSAGHPKGISMIDIFIDGRWRAGCTGTESCIARIPDLRSGSDIGAIAVNPEGEHGTAGSVPPLAGIIPPAMFQDDDGDGIINLEDNCRTQANRGQEDSDGDGVGDACDECDARRACGSTPFTDGSTATCEGQNEPLARGDYYRILYDHLGTNGCGCRDSDGLDYFTPGQVYEEVIGAPLRTRTGAVDGGSWCIISSDCEPAGVDQCLGATNLREMYCDSAGVGSEIIACPAGCRDGACLCPDTDGGYAPLVQGEIQGTSDYCNPAGHLMEGECSIERDGTLGVRWSEVLCRFGCLEGACICQDSDGGLNYDTRGMLGDAPGAERQYEDYCADSRTLVEYSAIRSYGGCYLGNTTHLCEGRCMEGQCLPPSCTDGIRNQGETAVDCGGPCSPCGFVRVSGTLLYEEADALEGGLYLAGDFKPIRYASVVLNPHGYSGLTDSHGYFEFMIPREAGVAFQLQVRPQNYAARVEKDFDWCNEYVWFSRDERFTIPAAGDVDLGRMEILAAGNRGVRGYWAEHDEWFCGSDTYAINGGSAYFNIAESILVARMYADGSREDSDGIGRVDVAYPDPTTSGVSWTSPFWDEIYLVPHDMTGRDSGFVDETIVHEYAHHLSEEISENDWAIDTHSACYRSDWLDPAEFAWFEGFAEYFSAFMTNRHRTGEYALSQERQYYAGIENPSLYRCGMYDYGVESAVCAALWDLVDEPGPDYPDAQAEPFDTVSGQDRAIFGIFDTELDNVVDAPTICEFIGGEYGWVNRFHGQPLETAIDPIMFEYGIFPGCRNIRLTELML